MHNCAPVCVHATRTSPNSLATQCDSITSRKIGSHQRGAGRVFAQSACRAGTAITRKGGIPQTPSTATTTIHQITAAVGHQFFAIVSTFHVCCHTLNFHLQFTTLYCHVCTQHALQCSVHHALLFYLRATNSTSNSSTAPPGMSPRPAPRSPYAKSVEDAQCVDGSVCCIMSSSGMRTCFGKL